MKRPKMTEKEPGDGPWIFFKKIWLIVFTEEALGCLQMDFNSDRCSKKNARYPRDNYRGPNKFANDRSVTYNKQSFGGLQF